MSAINMVVEEGEIHKAAAAAGAGGRPALSPFAQQAAAAGGGGGGGGERQLPARRPAPVLLPLRVHGKRGDALAALTHAVDDFARADSLPAGMHTPSVLSPAVKARLQGAMIPRCAVHAVLGLGAVSPIGAAGAGCVCVGGCMVCGVAGAQCLGCTLTDLTQ